MSKSHKVVVDDRMPQFKRRVDELLEIALNDGAKDILTKAVNKAPKDGGDLRIDSDVTRPSRFLRMISFYKEYAGAQEAGQRNGIMFRNYTTPGTGAHFLENAGNEVSKRMAQTFEKYGRRA